MLSIKSFISYSKHKTRISQKLDSISRTGIRITKTTGCGLCVHVYNFLKTSALTTAGLSGELMILSQQMFLFLQVFETGFLRNCSASAVWSCSTRSRRGCDPNFMPLEAYMKVTGKKSVSDVRGSENMDSLSNYFSEQFQKVLDKSRIHLHKSLRNKLLVFQQWKYVILYEENS